MDGLSERASSITRRDLIRAVPVVVGLPITSAAAAPQDDAPLAREIGITTGSFVRHLVTEPKGGKLRLLDLPRILRGELDMKVIDLMTATLPSLEPEYLDRLRDAAEREGCVLTNLKMNQPGLKLGSQDASERQKAIEEYKRTIVAAQRLGVRWVRPLPGAERPNLRMLATSYRQLIEFAAPRGISLLLENFGWLANDPSAIPAVIGAVGTDLAAQPDTGNWSNNEVRYAGLAKAFPYAASCDFKVRALGPNGEHDAYDLKRCFDIGWDAGFRGPWCFEHFHDDLAILWQELALLRNRLRNWMTARR
jgi:hypothetical protein